MIPVKKLNAEPFERFWKNAKASFFCGIAIFLTFAVSGLRCFDVELRAEESSIALPVVHSLKSIDVSTLTPADAYRYLVAGNAKYLGQETKATQELPPLIQGSNPLPLATVFYSSEMKKLPSELMKLSVQDLYQVPLNLKTFTPDELDDLEFGLTNLQTPVVLVLSEFPSAELLDLVNQFDVLEARARTEVDKIDATRSTFKTSNEVPKDKSIQLYNLIGPAIARAKNAYPDMAAEELVNLVAEAVVWQSMETMMMQSTTINGLLKSQSVSLIGGLVDDQTGQIYWLGSHPLEAEFLKDAAEGSEVVLSETARPIDESELPAPVEEKVINEYITEYRTTNYYNNVVGDYYRRPVYYEPGWQMFYPTVWTYRPRYGVWVEPFVPFPRYNPWAPPGVGVNFGLSFHHGRLHFYIGTRPPYARPVYLPPTFRPYDPFWGHDYYWNHRRPPVPHIPPAPIIPGPPPIHPNPFFPPGRPGPYRGPIPGVPFRPGEIPGVTPGFGPHNPGGPGRPFQPGRPTPGITPGTRPGDNPGGPNRPFQPGRPTPGITPGTRPGVDNPGSPSRPGRPTTPGITPGTRPGVDNPGSPSRPGRPTTPNISRPTPGNVSRPTTPNISRPTPGNVSRPTTPNISRPTPGNVSRPTTPNISRPTPRNVSRPTTPNISRPTPGNVSRPTTPNISRPTPRNVSRPTTPNISRPTPGNVSRPTTPNISRPNVRPDRGSARPGRTS